MAFTFEVKETDLLGRIGTIVANGKKIETPCLFPVVHPVTQAVALGDIQEAGFPGIMTNSFILYKRRREESLRQGIHRLLGFDGLLMTDSGGYQVLEYGDVDLSYSDIAEFQSKIGSDLAVTLDKPTGDTVSRTRAEETADYSNRNATATLERFAGGETTWIGPVQGGLFKDVLSKSTRLLVEAGFSYLALGSPVQVMENYRYAELVEMIAATRSKMPYSTPLHLFGAGHPHAMAISVALGCDTFDSASYILFAREGRYMTERGVSTLKEMKYLPCSCPVCRGRSVKDFVETEEETRVVLLAKHNLHRLREEVDLCKEAIAEGRLWDLVQERATVHPKLFDAFRKFAALSKLTEPGTAAVKDRGLFVKAAFDEARPELGIARQRMRATVKRDSRKALLLASDEHLPVSKLRFEGGSDTAEGCDIYGLHPQLGPYPAELDFVYPFTQTVSTTSSDIDERTEAAVRELRKIGYSRVIVASVDRSGTVSASKTGSRSRSVVSSSSPRNASSRRRAIRRL